MASTVTKRAHGIGSKHVLESEGPPVHAIHGYSSTYSVQFGQKKPTISSSFRHKGTGYSANFKPAVYYKKEVDDLQNPEVSKLLDGIYTSLSVCDYTPTGLPSGWEALPSCVNYIDSGFTQNLSTTRKHSSYPATGCSDSSALKSFRSNGFRVGSNKEDSGFTHACNGFEPVTFRPSENYSGSVPGEFTWRPTGCSVMSQDFNHPMTLTGIESLPVLSGGANLSNGFIKGNHFPVKAQQQETQIDTMKQLQSNSLTALKKGNLPVNSTVVHPNRRHSIACLFHPRQSVHRHSKSETDIGNKELSGYSNNHTYGAVTYGPHHFRHKSVYADNFRQLSTEQPNLPKVSWYQLNGFNKSTKVHNFGQSLDINDTFRGLHSYVARSLLCKEPYITNKTHGHKLRK